MAIDQIFEGKHLKRGMWVNIIIYLSFYKVYVDNILERYPDPCLELNTNSLDLDSVNNHLNKIKAEAKCILKIFSTFDESL